MGRSGSALVMLMPHEAAYVEFLQLRKVPLVEEEKRESLGASGQVLELLHKEAEADREVSRGGGEEKRESVGASGKVLELLHKEAEADREVSQGREAGGESQGLLRPVLSMLAWGLGGMGDERCWYSGQTMARWRWTRRQRGERAERW